VSYKGVAKSIVFVEGDQETDAVSGVLLISSSEHNKKKDTITENLVRFEQGQLTIDKKKVQTSNKVYAWCVSPYKYFDEDTIGTEYRDHNKYYTNRKSQQHDDEDTNANIARFLGHQNEDEAFDQHEKCVYIQYLNKKIQKYVPALLRNEEAAEFKNVWFDLTHLCSQIDAVYICGELAIFSLSNTSKLSINGKLFSKDCSSLLLTKDFMFFINSSQSLFHHLYVYNLNRSLPLPVADVKEPDPSKMTPKLPNMEDDSFHFRNVERGARLVS